MTEKEIKKQTQLQIRFLLSILNTLYNNNKVTFAEYSKIRDRIIDGKEVCKWLARVKSKTLATLKS